MLLSCQDGEIISESFAKKPLQRVSQLCHVICRAAANSQTESPQRAYSAAWTDEPRQLVLRQCRIFSLRNCITISVTGIVRTYTSGFMSYLWIDMLF